MKFQINLATRIYINARRLRFSTAVALLVLGVVLVLNISYIATKYEEINRAATEIATLSGKTKTASKEVPQKQYQALLNKISFANNVIEKKTYDWLSLLNHLEVVVPDGVAITSIEPELKTQGVKLVGVTRGFSNLRVLIEHLEDSKFFTNVYIVSQSEAKLIDNTQGITFNLTCKVINR